MDKTILRRAIDRHFDGSISAAARRLKVDASYLGKVLNGDRQPTLEWAEAVAKILGITTSAVLGGEPASETASERLSRRLTSDRKFIGALRDAQKSDSHRRKMRAARKKRDPR